MNNVEKLQHTHEAQKMLSMYRFNQLVWYILGVGETLLMFRIFFKAFGANPISPFTQFVYGASEPLAAPFRGMFRTITEGEFVFELSTFVGMIVYFVLAYGFIELVNVLRSPKSLE